MQKLKGLPILPETILRLTCRTFGTSPLLQPASSSGSPRGSPGTSRPGSHTRAQCSSPSNTSQMLEAQAVEQQRAPPPTNSAAAAEDSKHGEGPEQAARSGGKLLSAEELQQELRQLADEVTVFAAKNPKISGASKLLRPFRQMTGRSISDSLSASRDEEVEELATACNSLICLSNMEALEPRSIQGAVNNIRGVRAELLAAQTFPGVKAISKVFYSRPEEPQPLLLTRWTALATCRVYLRLLVGPKALAGKILPGLVKGGRRGLKVEADVVAADGAWWVEVKSHELFGTTSKHWVGYKGHTKGLRDQAEERLAVARCQCNMIRWRPPEVVFFFPESVDAGVAGELRQMGAWVVDGQEELGPQLPPGPEELRYANLDVTTMCALVSEVSNGGAVGGGTAEVLAWAQRVPHWMDCVKAEAEDPLLPQLRQVFRGRQLIASETAVHHFQKLLDTCGGPREKERWRRLLEETVVVCPQQDEARHQAPDNTGTEPPAPIRMSTQVELQGGMQIAGWPGVEIVDFFSERVGRMPTIGASHKWVLGLSDATQSALTVTAHGKMIKAATKQGINLEAFVHRAVWLSGL